jgi:hypothetical protein
LRFSTGLISFKRFMVGITLSPPYHSLEVHNCPEGRMRIVGKRFWTWMSVWALSLFVRGEMVAGPREQATTQESSSTTNSGHKVSTGANFIKKSEHKIRSKGSAKGVSTDVVSEKMNTQGLKTTTSSKTVQADASSKDAAKMTSGVAKTTDALTLKQKVLRADGSSKDPAYMTAKVHRHKIHK